MNSNSSTPRNSLLWSRTSLLWSRSSLLWRLSLGLLLVSLSGCEGCRQDVRDRYFDSLEKVGVEKRELLVKRVDKARDSQEEAQEEFEDALEHFQSLIGHDGGDLEAMYDSLKGEYEDALARANEVRERIDKVENVGISLFDEWQQEIDDFENSKFKRKSQDKLRTTKRRYDELLRTMQRASQSMDPVLTKLNDQVLFLKHNLNAQALGSLDQEVKLLETEVDRLLTDMRASIEEANLFIAEMSQGE